MRKALQSLIDQTLAGVSLGVIGRSYGISRHQVTFLA